MQVEPGRGPDRRVVHKQNGDYPKYISIDVRLILKLEYILESLNNNGIECHTLAILSGYRTPYYNKVIGNVKYSRHIYGSAADIFIDESPQDDFMDDLNKDGKVNLVDFSILLYYWKTTHHEADINIDGIVDLADFSIMMYCWTG